jgi:hypothetical protein
MFSKPKKPAPRKVTLEVDMPSGITSRFEIEPGGKLSLKAKASVTAFDGVTRNYDAVFVIRMVEE